MGNSRGRHCTSQHNPRKSEQSGHRRTYLHPSTRRLMQDLTYHTLLGCLVKKPGKGSMWHHLVLRAAGVLVSGILSQLSDQFHFKPLVRNWLSFHLLSLCPQQVLPDQRGKHSAYFRYQKPVQPFFSTSLLTNHTGHCFLFKSDQTRVIAYPVEVLQPCLSSQVLALKFTWWLSSDHYTCTHKLKCN